MGTINPSIDLRREAELAIVTIDNPPVNALKHEVRAGLAEAMQQARDDHAVAAVVLAGAGRGFSAGADITEFGKPTQPPGLGEVIAAIEAMPKPVVAAIHGVALGGGLELALACTLRLAAPKARLGLPEIKLGLTPGYGGTQRLPRLIGAAHALDMILTGRMVGAEEALRLGLVNRLAEGDLIAAGAAYARESSGYSLKALGLARDAVLRGLDLPFADALALEADINAAAFQTADAAEGTAAFLEKRKPVFRDT
jgi:enoyl-CoA hydratase/carnithine racemase